MSSKIESNEVIRISSREVAEMCEWKHHNLLQKIDSISKSLKNVEISTKMKIELSDYWVESSYRAEDDSRSYKEYLISKKGCEMLLHKMTGDKGVLFTHRYMQKFEEMERALNRPVLPQTYKEALICLVKEIEEKEKLQEIVKEQQPKVEYFDKLVDRSVNLNIRNTAKELGVKQTVFVNFLLDKKFLFRDRYSRLLPYSKFLNVKPYFAMKEFATEVNDGIQTLVTPQGRQYFLQRLRKEGLIKWEEEELSELKKTNLIEKAL